tara:strand:+ start:433 stop:600 length:168 start_codon:yes stop_codon:yes gene_type:complete
MVWFLYVKMGKNCSLNNLYLTLRHGNMLGSVKKAIENLFFIRFAGMLILVANISI